MQWATLLASSKGWLGVYDVSVSQDQFGSVGEGSEEGRRAISVISLLLYLGLD